MGNTGADFETWYHRILRELPEAAGGDRGVIDLMSEINRRMGETRDEEEILRCLELLRQAQALSQYNGDLFAALAVQVGLDAYHGNRFSLAERAFRMLADSGNRVGRNNLAYMIRRGETAPESRSLAGAMELLEPGVRDGDLFSLINMALLLALGVGGEDRWRLADRLISMTSRHTGGAMDWWGDLARAGDPEGYLVHLWLLRHGKAAESSLGTRETLYARVSEAIPELPRWMGEPA